MRERNIGLVLAGTVLLVACGREAPEAQPASPPAEAQAPAVASAPAAAPVAEDVVTPTVYPAPVSGGIDEINVGTFSLVDGLAYPAADGSGTLVYAVSKSIASPVLSRSACPRVFAESLAHLRDAGFAEVTLDAEGNSPYFAFGHSYGGTGKSLSPNEWSSSLEAADGKVKGGAKHKYHGQFEFELPLGAAQPPPAESEDSAATLAVYDRIRAAVKARDLKGVLAAQGFDAESIAAIRGLPDIDKDLETFATRFLEPGDPASKYPSSFYVGGKKADGKSYWNYYGFQKCGDALVLTSVNEDQRD